MLGVLFVMVSIALALIAVLAVVIFVRAAFWGEDDMTHEAKRVLNWRPPFMRGPALRSWAVSSAEALAQNRLRGKRSADMAVHLAQEVEEGAVHAMLPLASPAELERIVPCPSAGQGRVGLTAPEVLAVADELRRHSSPADVERIHRQAADNAKALAQSTRDAQPAALRCPLQGADRVCRTFGVRPLGCRPLHAAAVAAQMGSRNLEAEPASDEHERHEYTVAEGMELGLSRALQSAGLDGHVYELNSALAKALETPDVAGRWARGEDVFATCQRLEPEPTRHDPVVVALPPKQLTVPGMSAS